MIILHLRLHPEAKSTKDNYPRRIVLPNGAEIDRSYRMPKDYTVLVPYLGSMMLIIREDSVGNEVNRERQRLADVVFDANGEHRLIGMKPKDWDLSMEELKAINIHKAAYINRKTGNVYNVLGEATHSENGEAYVSYENKEGKLFVRPKWLFVVKFRLIGAEPNGVH